MFPPLKRRHLPCRSLPMGFAVMCQLASTCSAFMRFLSVASRFLLSGFLPDKPSRACLRLVIIIDSLTNQSRYSPRGLPPVLSRPCWACTISTGDRRPASLATVDLSRSGPSWGTGPAGVRIAGYLHRERRRVHSNGLPRHLHFWFFRLASRSVCPCQCRLWGQWWPIRVQAVQCRTARSNSRANHQSVMAVAVGLVLIVVPAYVPTQSPKRGHQRLQTKAGAG